MGWGRLPRLARSAPATRSPASAGSCGAFTAAHRSTEDLLAFLLEAGTLAPRSYLSLDDGDRRFLARRIASPRPADRARPGGPASSREYCYGLGIAVECNDYPLLWDPRAPLDRAHPPALRARSTRLPRDYFAPFSRREYLLSAAAQPDQLPALAGAAAVGFEPPCPPVGMRRVSSRP